jgi:hypothetical protein
MDLGGVVLVTKVKSKVDILWVFETRALAECRRENIDYYRMCCVEKTLKGLKYT